MAPSAYDSHSDDSDSDIDVRGLLRGIAEAFSDGMHADLTIEVGDRKWKVHKVIVCARCDYSRKACEGSFKEATSNTIRFQDDRPEAVNDWLQFLYKCEFDHPADFRGTVDLCLSVYQLADKYLVKSLGKFARKTIAAQLEDAGDADLAIAVEVLYGRAAESVPALQHCLDTRVRKDFLKLFGQPELYPKFQAAAGTYPNLAAKAATDWISNRPRVWRFRCTCAGCKDRDLIFEVKDSFDQSARIVCQSGYASSAGIMRTKGMVVE